MLLRGFLLQLSVGITNYLINLAMQFRYEKLKKPIINTLPTPFRGTGLPLCWWWFLFVMKNRLISMCDYTLATSRKAIEGKLDMKEAFLYNNNYAVFFKTPLERGMLEPYKDGVTLSEPNPITMNEDDLNGYHEAKNKVIFKGITVIREYEGMWRLEIKDKDGASYLWISMQRNIEDLFNKQSPFIHIILTDAKAKELNL